MRCEICDQYIQHVDWWYICKWCHLEPLCPSCVTVFRGGELCPFCVETVHEIAKEMHDEAHEEG